MRLKWWPVAGLMMLALVLAYTTWAYESSVLRVSASALRVSASVANFRAAPNGERLGTLLEGTQIERMAQEGEWVRFRVEGWVWGPSLDGFQPEPARPAPREEEPGRPLHDAVPRLRRYVDEMGGAFYSVELDAELQRITVRFRTQRVDPEALAIRQHRLQRYVVGLLEDQVEMDRVRVACNRADGSGTVGLEIAETAVRDLQRIDAEDMDAWRRVTRISHDGGKTWTNQD